MAVSSNCAWPAAAAATRQQIGRRRANSPACASGGRAAEAWHRILVYLPGTTLPPVTDNPTPLPLPTEELMLPTL
jgi:hypothetical protein